MVKFGKHKKGTTMKKIFLSLLLALTTICGLLGFAACGEKVVSFNVFYFEGIYEIGIKEYGGKDVEIPAYSEGKKISVIKENAFLGYNTLESVTIPNTIKRIERGAFSDCTALRKITYKGTKAEWDNITKEEAWIRGATKNLVSLYCADGVYSL